MQINFCGCPQKILTWKICQVEITVHVLPIKRLLATYTHMPLYFATEAAKCSQICAVCYPLQSEVNANAQKPFPIDNTLCDVC